MAAVASLAAAQEGTFARRQVRALGASGSFIDRNLRAGRWEHRLPGAYALAGVPESWERSLWLAHHAAGAQSVVSHESAAALHQLSGFPRREAVLTADHPEHRRLPGAFVHQISDLTPAWCTEIDGLPVTGGARTIVDLAAVCGPKRLEIALDEAVVAKLTGFVEVGHCLRSVARRGKPGVRKLTAILDARGPGYVPPQTKLERMLFDVLDWGGLPKPRRQFALPGRQAVTGCVDAAYLDCQLILEADGRRWHTRIADLKRDHARDTEAARAGWLTLRILYEDLRDHPAEVVASVRETRSARLRAFSRS